MNKRARTLSMAWAVALIVGWLPTGAFADGGDAYDPQYLPSMSHEQAAVVINDNMGNDFSLVGVQVPPKEAGTNIGAWHWCQDLTDSYCDFANATTQVAGVSVLPNCSENISEFCLDKLDLAAPNEDFKPAEFVRRAASSTIAPEPKYGYPGGSSPSLFTARNAPTAGALSTYAARVSLQLNFDTTEKKFQFGSFRAAVLPYRQIVDANIPGTNGNSMNGHACVFVEKGGCGIGQDWVPGTRARLSFRVPSSISGWFKGRLKAPTISITPVSKTVNEITVEAEPVSVPQLSLVKNQSELTSTEKSGSNWGGPSGMYFGLSSWDPSVASFIERYRAPLKDTATGTTSFWNLSSMDGGGGSACLADSSKVLGVVTTNSMGYDGSSPSFENGFLKYHVSGLHFAPNGTDLNEGTYDLVMRSDTARCLYGFTNAPISATISVISAAGETKTAVTTVTEKAGWLRMAAYGFTFSSPTISVKLSQAKASAVKTTITCVSIKNKKLTKKVTAVGPKCPAGYKKK